MFDRSAYELYSRHATTSTDTDTDTGTGTEGV